MIHLQKRWDVIMGELNAGNDSKDLKREARQYIILTQNMGMLTRDKSGSTTYRLGTYKLGFYSAIYRENNYLA
jgi:hypothetical protein